METRLKVGKKYPLKDMPTGATYKRKSFVGKKYIYWEIVSKDPITIEGRCPDTEGIRKVFDCSNAERELVSLPKSTEEYKRELKEKYGV